MELVDTHSHLQFPDYPLDIESVIRNTDKNGVARIIAVGCTLKDSGSAVTLAQKTDHVWASIGLHPHEAKDYVGKKELLSQFRGLASESKVIAIGECGLDYHYRHSPKEQQIELLHEQLKLAEIHHLPVIFHIREAFDDFWPILESYKHINGVVHSFNATTKELNDVLAHGLLVGLNGIMTFTKDDAQLSAAKAVPLDKLLLETDAPFLTPTPYRGTINQSKYVRVIAEFLSNLRGERLEDLAMATTQNAKDLFKLF